MKISISTPPSPSRRVALSATGGIMAALAATLCCAGPLVAVVRGVSGAGLARAFGNSQLLVRQYDDEKIAVDARDSQA